MWGFFRVVRPTPRVRSFEELPLADMTTKVNTIQVLRITSASRALVVHFGGYAGSLVESTAKRANITRHYEREREGERQREREREREREGEGECVQEMAGPSEPLAAASEV